MALASYGSTEKIHTCQVAGSVDAFNVTKVDATNQATLYLLTVVHNTMLQS